MRRANRSAPIAAATLFAALLGAGAPGDVLAADWPHLRGPNYNGVSAETGIVESWPATGPPVLWRIELGQGYSGIIAVGDRLYTQRQSLSGQYVVCLDADTGQPIWERRYGWPWEPDSNWPGPRATPTYHDGRIYFAGAFGLIGCLNAENGRRIWSVNVTEKFQGRGTEYGYACSPLVEDGKVFLPVGGKGAAVVALDARDGSLVWRSGDEQASYSPAYPITVGGQRQIVTFLRNVVLGFEPRTGQQLWEHQWSESYDEHAAWPVFEEPLLLTCAAFRGGARVLGLETGAAGASARLVWKSKVLSNDIFSSIVIDGHIYGFDLHDFQPRHTRPARGRFKCVKLATGEVCWSTDRTRHANVIAADGKLILFNELGELILARATPLRYEELCRTQVFKGEVCWTAPTLHRGRLYVRNQSHACCIYLGDPARLAAKPPKRAAPSLLARVQHGIWSGLAEIRKGHPLDDPKVGHVLRWYGYCMVVVLGASSVLALLAYFVAARRGPLRALLAGRVAFHCAVFLLGAAGTYVLSKLTGEFIFTWPAAIFAAYQTMLILAVQAKHRGKRAQWGSRAFVLAFLGLCYGYFRLCESLNLPMGFGFLVGILPAFPVAMLAAWRVSVRKRLLSDLLWAAVSFSAYFWASGLFTVWKTQA